MTTVARRIPWWQPQMTGRELDMLREVIDANYLNDGFVTERFEREIARRLGVKHVVAVTSGTAAICLALMAAGVKPGDEVIIPDLTFIATANAVVLAGGVPVLADIDPRTLTLDPEAAKHVISPRTAAVVPVHVSGRGAAMDEILAIAGQHGLQVIEDAAQAFVSRRRGRPLGTFGIAGCLSFSPNKSITTGQGGAIVTDDDGLHRRLRELKDHGRAVQGTGGDDIHPVVGFNFKLTNLQAAVGLAQIERLDDRLARQRAIYERYATDLARCPGIALPGFRIEDGETPLWTDAVAERRDELDRYLHDRAIDCRRFWLPLHRQDPYRRTDADFPVATRIAPKALWLPSAFTLTDADVATASAAISEFYGAPAA